MDEELRNLERAAATGDIGAGRALATALSRTGDRARALALLSQLARAGDRESIERLAGWTPWPGRWGLGKTHRARRPGLRHSGRVIARQHAGRGAIVAARDDLVYVTMATKVLALDTHTFDVRWEIPRREVFRGALLGDDILLEGHSQSGLHDGTTGKLLPTPPRRDGARFAVAGERVLPQPGTSLPFDDNAVICLVDHVASSVAAFALLGEGVSAFDLETGRRVWSRPLEGRIQAADERGVVVGTESGTFELDAATGEERWRSSARSYLEVGLGGEVAILASERVVAVARDTGREAWSADPPMWERVAVSDDVVYGAWDEGVVALDLATGEKLWERLLPEVAGRGLVSIVPLERALVLAFLPRGDRGRTTAFVRIA